MHRSHRIENLIEEIKDDILASLNVRHDHVVPTKTKNPLTLTFMTSKFFFYLLMNVKEMNHDSTHLRISKNLPLERTTL